MNLKNKKVLFICPRFHDYENLIKEKLEDFGAIVRYFPERSYGLDFNIVNNFLPNKMNWYQDIHYNEILKEVNEERFDFLFVVRGYKMPSSFIKRFKALNCNCKTIMYQWDSNKMNYYSDLIPYFDKVASFDFKDCSMYNLEYIPLFYTDDVINYLKEPKQIEFDFFFMGYYFDERYEGLIKFKKFCEKNNYTLKAFLFMPYTTKVKYFLKNRPIDKEVVFFKQMPRNRYLKILSRSRVMVDVSSSSQTGLAMRVIESLACNTKIVTTNPNFMKDQIIAKSNMINLINMDKIDISSDFILDTYERKKANVFSIGEWLTSIFE